MDTTIKQLEQHLKQHQLDEIVSSYIQLSDEKQTLQLQHLFQLACNSEVKYLYLQNVATRLLQQTPIPNSSIELINDSDALSFFTPGLKFHHAFSRQDSHSNTLLHYLFSHCQAKQLPFNYLRSLMLFESNESIATALRCENHQQLTPIGCFIAHNPMTQGLPKHEFSALLAMMEAAQPPSAHTIAALIKQLKSFYQMRQPQLSDSKILLCATYLQVAASQVLNTLRR